MLSKYADDTNLLLKNFRSLDICFEVFQDFKEASGSCLRDNKTQIMVVGDTGNNVDVPEKYRNYITEMVKVYGVFFSKDLGLHAVENWRKPEQKINDLLTCVPPPGISIYGKVNSIMTYYLSSFWYITCFLKPPENVRQNAEIAMDRYIWYPSRTNIVSKQIIKLPSALGGCFYPDLDLRFYGLLMMRLIKRWRDTESLRWHESFDHFREMANNEQSRDRAPAMYKHLYEAENIFQIVRVNEDIVSIKNKNFPIKSVRLKPVLEMILESKFRRFRTTLDTRLREFYGAANPDPYKKLAWSFSKVRFVDGYSRHVHFLVTHNALFTRALESRMFDGVVEFCKYCFERNFFEKEDVKHIFLECPRAVNFWEKIFPILNNILGNPYIFNHFKLIFGYTTMNRKNSTLINMIIQVSQRCIWQARQRHEKDKVNDMWDDFRLRLFICLNGARFSMPDRIFRRFYCAPGFARLEFDRISLDFN